MNQMTSAPLLTPFLDCEEMDMEKVAEALLTPHQPSPRITSTEFWSLSPNVDPEPRPARAKRERNRKNAAEKQETRAVKTVRRKQNDAKCQKSQTTSQPTSQTLNRPAATAQALPQTQTMLPIPTTTNAKFEAQCSAQIETARQNARAMKFEECDLLKAAQDAFDSLFERKMAKNNVLTKTRFQVCMIRNLLAVLLQQFLRSHTDASVEEVVNVAFSFVSQFGAVC